jgi:hypothetical protein
MSSVFKHNHRLLVIAVILCGLGYLSAGISYAAFLSQFYTPAFQTCTNQQVKTNNALSQWWSEQPHSPGLSVTGSVDTKIYWWAPSNTWIDLSEIGTYYATGNSNSVTQREDIAGFGSTESWLTGAFHTLTDRVGGDIANYTGWFYKSC